MAPDDARRDRVFSGAALVVGLACLSIGAIRLAREGAGHGVLWTAAVGLASLLAFAIQRHRRSRTGAGLLLIGTGIAAIFATAHVEGGLLSQSIVWLPAVPVIAGMLVGIRAALLLSGACIAGLVWLAVDAPVATVDVPVVVRFAAAAGAVVALAALAWLYEQSSAGIRARLERSLERHAALVEALPDVTLLLDRAGRVRDLVAPEGWPIALPATPVGDSIGAVFPGPLGEQIAAAALLVATRGDPVSLDLQVVSAGGRCELEVRIVPAPGGEVLAVLRDVTAVRASARAKDHFVSVVSHELRTPLTSIRGALGLLSGGATASELPESARRLVAMADRNSVRLANLVDDILDFSGLHEGRLELRREPVLVDALVAAAIEAHAGYASSYGVQVTFIERVGDGVAVTGDRDRLLQVMANLLSNATKFSPTDRPVQVRTMMHDAGTVRVAVSDKGPGIPAEFRPSVFERFSQADETADRVRSGSGLGLSISQAIVKQLGGQIQFDTFEGEGTTFWFALPRRLAPRSVGEHGEGAAVLVVEDDPDVSEIVHLMLEQAGYRVDHAGTVAEARLKLAMRRFDAITLDIRLPDGSGLDVLRALRGDRATAQLPAIMLTAYAAEGRAEHRSEALPIIDWVPKPIDGERLVRAVSRAVRHGSRPSILHVEDDPLTRRIVHRALRDLGEVQHADTNRAALEVLHAHPVDVVILDLGLPDGSGHHLLHTIRARGLHVPVIVYSAQTPGPDTASLVDASLLKGHVAPAALAETVREVLAQAAGGP